MVTGRITHENYIECLPGDPIIGELMRHGATIYRYSEAGKVLIVPNGKSHSDVWRIAMGR